MEYNFEHATHGEGSRGERSNVAWFCTLKRVHINCLAQ